LADKKNKADEKKGKQITEHAKHSAENREAGAYQNKQNKKTKTQRAARMLLGKP